METFGFSKPVITQAELVDFADEKVNLKKEHAADIRAKVGRIRDNLNRYITEHPELGLVKSMLSGSLAKGTALSTLNDVDVALYVKGDIAPQSLHELITWLIERLRETYHQIPFNKIYADGPCIVVEYSSAPKVEITPILYFGGANDRGWLWDRSTGKKVETSIPLHLDFTRKRKEKQPTHYAQVIRLVKWWSRNYPNVELRSFLVELLLAKVFDTGFDFSDYHDSMEKVFSYIQNSQLKERIAFTDNYAASALPTTRLSTVEIFDPVTPGNNVADSINETQRQRLVQAAADSLDELSYARTSQTKGIALECWRTLMGTSFNA